MVAARNARRRARGLPEESASEVEMRVSGDLRDQERRRQAYLADRELDQLLEATNRRRRARGLTRADAGGGAGGVRGRPARRQLSALGALPDHRMRLPGPAAGA